MAVTKELIHGINLMMAGKEEGFNTVYKETYSYVYSRARSIMKNDEDAEELLQEVYVAMYRSIDTLQDVNNIYGWLKSVTYNQGMKLYSKKKDVLLSEDAEGIFDMQETEDKDVIPGEKMDEEESAEFVKGLIDELPESQRAVILAYYYDNMSVSDIAKMMSVSDGTIKSRLNYARQYIKKAYLEKGKEYSMYSVTGPVMLLAIEMMMKGYSFLPEKAAAAGAGLWSAVNAAGGAAEAAVTAISVTETAITGGTAAAGGTVAAGTTSAVAVKVAIVAATIILTTGGGVMFGTWKYQENKKKQQTVVTTEQVTEEAMSENDVTESIQTAEEDSTQVTEEEAATEEVAALSEFDKLKISDYYAGVIRMFQCGATWPDGTELTEGTDYASMSDNQFAIADVDQDGMDELLLHYTTGSMASMLGGVFKYDISSDILITELQTYPSHTFYDNGMVVCGESHNQGLGVKIWPYTLYSYNSDTRCYEAVGSASCWDKEVSPDNFPEDVDKDRDGTIYSISDTEGNTSMVDQAEYDNWYNGYMGNAQELPIEYFGVTDDNISPYVKGYIDSVCDMVEAEQDGQGYDAGIAYAKSAFSPDGTYAGNNVKDVMNEIENKCGLTFERERENGVEYFIREGNAEFYVVYEDVGYISYSNEPISGLAIMGIKPGDSAEEAAARLTGYGFRLEEDGGYVSGSALGNIRIYFEEENDVIRYVSLSPYVSFGG